jgi:DNA helicase-2/ATP-dependent DNA helicase PcrA
VFEFYEKKLRIKGKVDFDDILIMCLRLLEKRPDIRQMWQEKYPYILVDEFQDINGVQFEVLKLLSGMEANLFIVGDDDQSIYGFRGGTPSIMLEMKEYYLEIQTVLLNVNYRSGIEIVNFRWESSKKIR